MKPSGARGAGVSPRAFVARTALVCVSCLSCACAAPLMKLPSGPGTPAADAPDALAQATAACRGIRALTAEIAISGSAGGRRVRGRLSTGVSAPASVRLEAVAPFGPPVFIFAASDNNDATLLLPRDNRVLEHGRPDQVLDAVAGVPLDAADLYATLTGCAPAGSPSQGRDLGTDWRVVSVSAGPVNYELYLHRDRLALPWKLVATTRESATDGVVRVEYRNFQNGLPRAIHMKGLEKEAFDLTLALSQVETNVPLGSDVFRLEIPPSADPITVDELRRARLGIRKN